MPRLIKPPHGSRIIKGHPLARDLIACYLFDQGGAFASIALGATVGRALDSLGKNHLELRNYSASNLGAAPLWDGSSGRGPVLSVYDDIVLSSSAIGLLTNSAPTTQLLPTDQVSVFWYGMVGADMPGTSQNNPPAIYMVYNAAVTTPFLSYGFARKSNNSGNVGNTDLYFFDDIGGSLNLLTAASGIPAYKSFFSIGQSLKSGSQLGYVNGVQKVSSTNSGSISYGTGPFLLGGNDTTGFAGTTGGTGNWIYYVAYIWHRFLTPSEHAWLNADPLVFVEPLAAPKTYFLMSAPPPPFTIPDVQMPQLLVR